MTATYLDRLLDEAGDPLAVEIDGVPYPCDQVGPVTIRHGRNHPSSRPDAAVCTLTIRASDTTDPPTLGNAVTVDLGPAALALWFPGGGAPAAAAAPLFLGKVTDVKARLDGSSYVYQVTAASQRAILGRLYLGDEPWPEEQADFRALRIFDLVDAQEPISWEIVGAMAVAEPLITSRDVDRQPALGLLDELADDVSAMLVETRASVFSWQAQGFRAAFVEALTLDASEVLAPAEWVQNQAGIVTDLEVRYGYGDPRASVRGINGPDPDFYPVTSAASIDSQLVDEVDAQALVDRTLELWATPRWWLESLTVDVVRRGATGTRVVDAAKTAVLMGLDVSALIAVDGFPLAGPFATRRLWLEGWTETITAKGWRFALDVSDYAGTAVAPTYTDLTATGMTYADLTANGSTYADLSDPTLIP
jgi:hypothetical protein